MKTQTEVNKSWQQPVNTEFGTLTLLTPPKKQSNLRKPYEYEASKQTVEDAAAQLKKLAREYQNGGKIQIGMIETKSLAFGKKIELFYLGFAPGLCGDNRGLVAAEWDKLISDTKQIMDNISTEIPMYVEPWIANRKFQARATLYIKFP
jgi:hypothetical protein